MTDRLCLVGMQRDNYADLQGVDVGGVGGVDLVEEHHEGAVREARLVELQLAVRVLVVPRSSPPRRGTRGEGGPKSPEEGKNSQKGRLGQF